jgi:hypothetical protein
MEMHIQHFKAQEVGLVAFIVLLGATNQMKLRQNALYAQSIHRVVCKELLHLLHVFLVNLGDKAVLDPPIARV